MADVHKNLSAPAGAWTEATQPFGIAEGAKWGFEARVAAVEVLETDAADEPSAGVRGQSLYPGTPRRRADRLAWTRETGRYLWFRGAHDSAVVVAAPA